MDDLEHMRRAMTQAAMVRSTTAPHPGVGCVVVPPDSGPDPPGHSSPERPRHRAAPTPRWRRSTWSGTAARGATLYVTLEPCAHHGRTPPCTEAIVAAGVARVVVGIEDPDQRVAGGASPRCARPGSRSASGWPATRSPSSWPPTASTGRRGSPGWSSRWRPAWTPAPPPPTAPAVGSPGRRRAGTSTGCAPGPTPCWWARARSAPISPSSTVRLDDGVERRQPLRVGSAGHPPGPTSGRRIVGRPAGRAHRAREPRRDPAPGRGRCQRGP